MTIYEHLVRLEEQPILVAHLPLVLGPDGAKLSKRHGATSVFEYRDAGYLPDAIFNFLGLLGWSLDDHTEIISREQFIEHFTLDRIVKNPAVFNIDKLTWMNGMYIREMPEERLTELFADTLERDFPGFIVIRLRRCFGASALLGPRISLNEKR